MKTTGKIIKIIIYTFVFAVCALIIGRIMLMEYEGKLDELVPNGILAEAYTDGKLDAVTHEVYDEISKQGLFAAYKLVYVRDAKQMQFSLRFNDSAYEYANLSPDRELTFFLYNTVTEKYTLAATVTADELLMYNYRRVVFDGIDAEDGADYYVYISADGTSEGAFDSLPIHYGTQNEMWEEYKLSDGERTALSK